MDKRKCSSAAGATTSRFVRLQFTEPYGQLKNVSIPVEELEKALDNELMFDGSSIRGFKRIEQSDMYFHPDPATYSVLPWRGREEPARRAADLRRRRPGRHAVRRRPALEPEAGAAGGRRPRLHDAGRPRGRVLPVPARCRRQPDRRSARRRHLLRRRARSTAARTCRRDIEATLQKMGFHLEAAHHEVAIGQHEIDFRHADALTTADNLITFRMVVKVIAAAARHARDVHGQADLHGENGSGMHINQSLSRGERECLPRRVGRPPAVDRGVRLHRRHPRAPAGDHGRGQPDGQLVQAAAARLRGAGLHRVVAGQPLGGDPRAGQARPLDARSSCARPTRPRTRTWRWPACSRRACTGSRAGSSRRRPSTATSTT